MADIRTVHGVVLTAVTFLLAGGLVLFLIPGRYLPPHWVRYVSARGNLPGKLAELRIPNWGERHVRVSLRINMTADVCRVSRVSPDGEVVDLCRIGQGQCWVDIPVEDTLRLDPGAGNGRYRMSAGWPWGRFGPSWRMLGISCCAGALAEMMLGRRRRTLRAWRGIKGRHICLTAAVAVVSGLVLYPSVHEFGHYIIGLMLGGQVREVRWTIFSGDPGVSFNRLPDGAGPWMSAAGPIVPTIVAVLLVCIWLWLGRRVRWYTAVCLLVPAVIFLLSNLGCVIEAFDSGAHMNRLSTHLGLSGVARVAFEMLPVAVSAVVVGLVLRRLRRRHPSGTDA
ncbi:MAG TPA: hypothetical protein ENN81_07965 [Phycisphaerales bacterium]|nr:hypothetical protein [Phycisphaerales bacterium]